VSGVQLTIRIVRVNHRRQIRVFDAATGTLRYSLFPFGKAYRGNFQVHTRDVDGVPAIVARIGLGHNRFITRVFSGLDGGLLEVIGVKAGPSPSLISHSTGSV
jgi:hypothetical protein